MRKNLQNISLSYWKLIVNNKDLLICYMYYTCHFYTLLLFVTALFLSKHALRGIHWGKCKSKRHHDRSLVAWTGGDYKLGL